MYEKDGIVYAGENKKVFSIVSVRNLGNYNLLILFSNHQERIVDCKKLLDFKIFEELKDINVFIDTCTVLNDTLAWDICKNRDNTTCLDIDPDTLYELPNVKERIA